MAHDLHTPHPRSTSGVPLGLRCLGAIWVIWAGGSQPLALPLTESRPGEHSPRPHRACPAREQSPCCLAQGLGA